MNVWQLGVAANIVVAIVYVAIAVGMLRPVLRARAEGINLLGLGTAAIFVSCSVHHGGHALLVATQPHMRGQGLATAMLVGWDVLGMAVATAYWLGRRGYGNLLRPGQVYADLATGRAAELEQAALRRVAVAVAEEREPEAVFDLVAREAAELMAADCGLVTRFTDDEAVVVGTHGRHGSQIGLRFPREGQAALAQVARTGRAARADYRTIPDDPVATSVMAQGYSTGIAAPVWVRGRLWGAVLVAALDPAGLAARGLEERVSRFADLVGLAIANTDARAHLTEQASTDALTGLLNHRAFHERLAAECERARAAGTPYAVLVLDLDNFKAVNDTHGHQVGDRVLAEFGRRLRTAVRRDDVAARIGGEEFAVLVPGGDEDDARRLAARVSAAVRDVPFPVAGTLTVSGGVCGSARAVDGHDVMRLADGALYWAKADGRDRTVVYAPDVVKALSAEERAEGLLRERALAALNALAQAVDAKDHSTREHSERVADLAVQIATCLGWSPQDVVRIREAGLLHDVGKIGVPDGILLKPGPLTDDEFAQVKLHAPLGAQIVSDVLDAEQVAWVRHHHERWTGGGYPDGISGEDISPGARILALADAWDAMTAPRPYSDGMDVSSALRECRANAGVQFAPEVVDALEMLAAVGALGPPVATSPRALAAPAR